MAWQRQELGELQDQKAALEAQIPTLQATVDELAAKGGKIKLSACGKDQTQMRQGQYRHGDLRQGGRELHDFGWVLMPATEFSLNRPYSRSR